MNFRDRRMEEVIGISATMWMPYEENQGIVRGLALGLPGTEARSISGVAAALVGVGVHDDFRGIGVGGIGLGIGGNARGLLIGGVGGDMEGISIAGASAIEGIAVASAIGTEDAGGLIIAPLYFKISPGGRMKGVNLSAYNDVRGTQQGLAIALFNYARTLDGVQLGLLNYAGNKSRGTRLLPIVNFARRNQGGVHDVSKPPCGVTPVR